MNQIVDNSEYPIIDISSIVQKQNETMEPSSTGVFYVFSQLGQGLVDFECSYLIK